MKRVFVFLLVILMFYGVGHSRDAMLFIEKFDDSRVFGKLLKMDSEKIFLLTQKSSRESVQIKDIKSVTYHINKGKPWGAVLAGLVIGGAIGAFSHRERPYNSAEDRGGMVLGWSVLGTCLGTIVALVSPQSKKSGQITLQGKSHYQKMRELKRFEKYAMIKKRGTYYRGGRR